MGYRQPVNEMHLLVLAVALFAVLGFCVAIGWVIGKVVRAGRSDRR